MPNPFTGSPGCFGAKQRNTPRHAACGGGAGQVQLLQAIAGSEMRQVFASVSPSYVCVRCHAALYESVGDLC